MKVKWYVWVGGGGIAEEFVNVNVNQQKELSGNWVTDGR